MQEGKPEMVIALVGEAGAGKSELYRRLRGWLAAEPLREWPGLTPVDSPGLRADIAATAAERQAQAQALRLCAESPLLLHVLDASRERLFLHPGAALSPLDAALAHWGRTRGGYVAVATKMDRPGARAGLLALQRGLAGLPLAPVSSLCGTGWAELRGSLRQMASGR